MSWFCDHFYWQSTKYVLYSKIRKKKSVANENSVGCPFSTADVRKWQQELQERKKNKLVATSISPMGSLYLYRKPCQFYTFIFIIFLSSSAMFFYGFGSVRYSIPDIIIYCLEKVAACILVMIS